MGGIFDFLTGGDKKSQDYLSQALQSYQNLQTPTADQLRVNNLPLESVQGTIDPQQLQSIEENLNQLQGVSLNPGAMSAQQQALSQFQNIANSGGLDANARLGIQQAADAANNNLRGNLGAIMQNAQAQGNANSGAVLAQRLAAAQGSANNLQNQDLQAAAMAENNRQNAIANVANLGSNLASQNMNADVYNANNKNAVTAQNVATRNAAANTNVANNLAAQNTNLANAQNVNAANTTAKQGNAYYNAQTPQQVYQDQLSKAQGQAGVYGNQAATSQQNAAQNAALLGGVLGAGGQIAASGMGKPPVGKAGGGMISLEDFVRPRRTGLITGPEVTQGNSPSNDVIPANLSAGEVVIPKEVAKDTQHIKEFMRHAPVDGTDKKVNLEDFFKRGK